MSGLGTFGGHSSQFGRAKVGGASAIQDSGPDMIDRARELRFEGDEGASSYRSAIGQFTRDLTTATGTQSITGLGFKPRQIYFFTCVLEATGRASFGFTNGSSNLCNFDAFVTSADTWQPSSARCIYNDQGAVNFYRGSIDGTNGTMDVDGFTISWVKDGSPTGTLTVSYFAIR